MTFFFLFVVFCLDSFCSDCTTMSFQDVGKQGSRPNRSTLSTQPTIPEASKSISKTGNSLAQVSDGLIQYQVKYRGSLASSACLDVLIFVLYHCTSFYLVSRWNCNSLLRYIIAQCRHFGKDWSNGWDQSRWA
jgi:hypothetical protein